MALLRRLRGEGLPLAAERRDGRTRGVACSVGVALGGDRSTAIRGMGARVVGRTSSPNTRSAIISPTTVSDEAADNVLGGRETYTEQPYDEVWMACR